MINELAVSGPSASNNEQAVGHYDDLEQLETIHVAHRAKIREGFKIRNGLVVGKILRSGVQVG